MIGHIINISMVDGDSNVIYTLYIPIKESARMLLMNFDSIITRVASLYVGSIHFVSQKWYPHRHQITGLQNPTSTPPLSWAPMRNPLLEHHHFTARQGEARCSTYLNLRFARWTSVRRHCSWNPPSPSMVLISFISEEDCLPHPLLCGLSHVPICTKKSLRYFATVKLTVSTPWHLDLVDLCL